MKEHAQFCWVCAFMGNNNGVLSGPVSNKVYEKILVWDIVELGEALHIWTPFPSPPTRVGWKPASALQASA